MDDRKKLNCGIRDGSPCKDCTERFLACSDHCPKDERGEYGYKAWKAKLDAVNGKRKAYNNLNRRKRWQRMTF